MVPDEVSRFCPRCGKNTAVIPAVLSIIVASPNTPPWVWARSVR